MGLTGTPPNASRRLRKARTMKCPFSTTTSLSCARPQPTCCEVGECQTLKLFSLAWDLVKLLDLLDLQQKRLKPRSFLIRRSALPKLPLAALGKSHSSGFLRHQARTDHPRSIIRLTGVEFPRFHFAKSLSHSWRWYPLSRRESVIPTWTKARCSPMDSSNILPLHICSHEATICPLLKHRTKGSCIFVMSPKNAKTLNLSPPSSATNAAGCKHSEAIAKQNIHEGPLLHVPWNVHLIVNTPAGLPRERLVLP